MERLFLILCIGCVASAGCGGSGNKALVPTEDDRQAAKNAGDDSRSQPSKETVEDRQRREGLQRIAAMTSGISTPMQIFAKTSEIHVRFNSLTAKDLHVREERFGDLRFKLEEKVKARLREAKIELWAVNHKKDPPSPLKIAKLWLIPTLDLEIYVMKTKAGGFIYHYQLVLREHVQLSRDPNLTSHCTLPAAYSVIGSSGGEEAMLRALESYVDSALTDFVQSWTDAHDPEFNKAFSPEKKQE